MKRRQEDFSIGLRRKGLSFLTQFFPQFQIVVQLAVVDDAPEPIPIGHGLMAAWSQVNDRQSLMRQNQ